MWASTTQVDYLHFKDTVQGGANKFTILPSLPSMSSQNYQTQNTSWHLPITLKPNSDISRPYTEL